MFQPEILERFLTHIHQAVVCLGIEPGCSTAGLSKYCQIITDVCPSSSSISHDVQRAAILCNFLFWYVMFSRPRL